MNTETGRKGGRLSLRRLHPLAEGHDDVLPDGQFARQAKLAHSGMEADCPARDDGGMPASKPKRPAPVTLRKWRLFRGLTLEQVGNIVGKGGQAVHKWETGKTPVDLEALKLLAQAYETTPDALLFDPADEALIQRMRAAHEVLKSLPSQEAENWLRVGQTMAGATKAPDKK